MQRNKHSLSHTTLTSMELGKLYPVSCVEVGMGDSIQGSTSALVRVMPQNAPVMHPVHVRIDHYFVPFRLVWDGFEDFITGGADGLGGSAGAFPTIASGAGFAVKSLPDYLGIPPSIALGDVSALFIRAYNKVWNEWYRDEDLQTEVTQDQLTILPVRWRRDYFTGARPWPQKGPAVTLPLGSQAPIATDATLSQRVGVVSTAQSNAIKNLYAPAGDSDILALGGTTVGGTQDLYADLSTATAATVSQLREAMALQRYEEARAQWGHRFPEYLRYYGIKSSDARLQRPEHLGSGQQRVAFTEVLQTNDNGAVAGVGDMYGHGIAAARSNQFLRFFEEHGVLLTLMSVVPEAIYVQGLHRKWKKSIKEDFFTPELALIGQQEVYDREVYAVNSDTVFGYQDRYQEYTEEPSTVTGEMRSTLDFMHYGRKFGSAPALNAAFVSAADVTKRVYQVSTNDVLWVQAVNRIRARRMVERNPRSRIL